MSRDTFAEAQRPRGRPSTYSTGEYLTCAETAKLVRAALKRAFPGVKFRVRSSVYAGGAAIDVGWIDGPRSEAVERVAGAFAGADFDGMVDLKTYSQHWLNPDGTVTTAYAGAGGSTLPEYIGDAPGPNARLVRLGAARSESRSRVRSAT